MNGAQNKMVWNVPSNVAASVAFYDYELKSAKKHARVYETEVVMMLGKTVIDRINAKGEVVGQI